MREKASICVFVRVVRKYVLILNVSSGSLALPGKFIRFLQSTSCERKIRKRKMSSSSENGIKAVNLLRSPCPAVHSYEFEACSTVLSHVQFQVCRIDLS